MKLKLIKILIAAFPFLFFSDSVWKVKSSAITFKIKNAGVTAEGSFPIIESNIVFNPLKPESASISASVNVNGINTGSDMKDKHLKKEEYFDAAKFPKISMQSVKIEKTGPISFNGTFKLTIKGVTKEITMPFNFIKIPEKTEFKGSFTINRRDFGVGGSSMTMADNVTVSIVVNVTE